MKSVYKQIRIRHIIDVDDNVTNAVSDCVKNDLYGNVFGKVLFVVSIQTRGQIKNHVEDETM
jgi:hypothetical protein